MKKLIFCLISVFFLVSLVKFDVQAQPIVKRISGSDRYKTSIEVSKAGWESSQYVILASGEDYADGLSGTPLAKMYNAPIILTNGQDLSEDIASELSRLKAKTVIILGGSGAISDKEEASLVDLGYNCRRIFGNNRYETSVKIAEEFHDCSEIFIASGNNYPDGLSISSVAAMKGAPILLVSSDEMDESVEKYISNSKAKNIYVIGGTGVINESIFDKLNNAERICGSNRYDTNMKIFDEFFGSNYLNSSYIASGENFPDALVCSILSAKYSKPLILMDKSGSTSTYNYLYSNRESITDITVVGGGGAIRPKVINNLTGRPNSLIDNLNSVGNSTQVIIVEASSFNTFRAEASAYELVGGEWEQYIAPFDSVIGMRGFSTNRHEGDKTTPVGAYHFPFLFGWNGNPGFKFSFRTAGPYDYWVSNSNLKEYNIWMTYTGNPKNRFADYEHLASQPLYKYAAVIDFNYGSDKVYGKGSGIFMHIAPYSGGGTLGCVGMPEDNLVKILMWMDPSKNPTIIMGPTSELNNM